MDVTRKQSTPNFPKKESFLPPDMHTYVSRTQRSFLGKFGVLYFLVTLVLRFALLPYYRQYNKKKLYNWMPIQTSEKTNTKGQQYIDANFR